MNESRKWEIKNKEKPVAEDRGISRGQHPGSTLLPTGRSSAANAICTYAGRYFYDLSNVIGQTGPECARVMDRFSSAFFPSIFLSLLPVGNLISRVRLLCLFLSMTCVCSGAGESAFLKFSSVFRKQVAKTSSKLKVKS